MRASPFVGARGLIHGGARKRMRELEPVTDQQPDRRRRENSVFTQSFTLERKPDCILVRGTAGRSDQQDAPSLMRKQPGALAERALDLAADRQRFVDRDDPRSLFWVE